MIQNLIQSKFNKKKKYIDLILENKYNCDSTMNPFLFGYGYYFKINQILYYLKKEFEI